MKLRLRSHASNAASIYSCSHVISFSLSICNLTDISVCNAQMHLHYSHSLHTGSQHVLQQQLRQHSVIEFVLYCFSSY